MTATSTRRSGLARPSVVDLDYMATTARNGLRCDCTVVTWCTGEEELLVGADGLGADERQEIHSSLLAIADTFRSDDARSYVQSCADGPHDFPASIGFAQHLAVPMIVEERIAGLLHVLNRSSADRVDPALLETLGAYCAGWLRNERLCSGTLVERAAERAALHELSFAADNLTDLIRRLERALSPIFGAIRIGLMVWDDERAVLQMVRGSFGAPESITASHLVDVGDSRSNAAWVFGILLPYVSNHEVDDPGVLHAYADAFGVEHLLSAPLGDAERHTGILHIARNGRAFSAEEVSRCDEILPRVIVAVEATRMRVKLSLQRQVEAVLSEQAVAIASGAWSNDCLLQALEDLRGLFRASVIALVPTEARPLVARDPATPALVEQRLLQAARDDTHQRTESVRPEGRGNPGSTALYMPVRLGTRLIGMLATFRGRYESFTAEERHGLSRMAELIALSWASERYQQHRAALARLEERQRIADDLHDDVAQILCAAQMHLDGILEYDPVAQEVRSRAARARALLIRGDKAIRNVITKLSQPPATGLPDRLYEVVEGIDEEFTVPVHIEISGDAEEASRRTRRAVADTLVKVAREALVNAAKHAGPCRASVTLDLPSPQRLRLRVSDTGAGESARPGGASHGLASLRRSVRRHGGSLRVTRGRTDGTTVTVSMPL